MWNGGTDAKTGEKLKYVSNDAKTGKNSRMYQMILKRGKNSNMYQMMLKRDKNSSMYQMMQKRGENSSIYSILLKFFYCIYMYNLQCIICTQSRGAKMHKNRNDCAKHNIIKYDIKKTKQIQIIYANMHGYTSTCNRDIIDIV